MVGHSIGECECFNNSVYEDSNLEQVNFVGNQFQGKQGNNPFSNTYNPGWRNHPKFSWNNNNNLVPQGFQKNIARQAPSDF